MASHRGLLTSTAYDQVLQDANAWLNAHPKLNGTTALFSTCLNLSYMLDKDVLGEEHTKYVVNVERMLQTTFSVDQQGETLLPLPPAEIECTCADLSQLSVQQIYLSGSVREGTDVRLFMSDVSDMDVMFQLGPVTIKTDPSLRWPIGDLDEQLSSLPQQLLLGEGAYYHEEAQPLTVTMHPTEHPGYVLLQHRPRPGCKHELPNMLSSSRVIALIASFTAVFKSHCSHYSGPSVTAMIEDFALDSKSIDLVACLVCPSWPCKEFFSRPRPSGQPSAELVQRLCGTPAFLVPAGYPGSHMKHHQWRLSFSRHEYIVYRYMTETQRAILSVLKHCRAVLGEPARPVKSIYLKTALMWLCEKADWNRDTFHASLLDVLSYVRMCTRRGFMPLYFWPEVNLMSGSSPAELAKLGMAIEELVARLLSASLTMVAQWIGQPVCQLAPRLLLDEQLFTPHECITAKITTIFGDIGRHDLCGILQLKGLVFNGKLPMWKQIMPLPLSKPRQVFTSMLQRLKNNGIGDKGAENQTFLKAFSLMFPATRPSQLNQTNTDSWLAD